MDYYGYKVGDLVEIIPFDEIRSELGDSESYFGISKETINTLCKEPHYITDIDSVSVTLDCGFGWRHDMIKRVYVVDLL